MGASNRALETIRQIGEVEQMTRIVSSALARLSQLACRLADMVAFERLGALMSIIRVGLCSALMNVCRDAATDAFLQWGLRLRHR